MTSPLFFKNGAILPEDGPWISLGSAIKFTTALNILRAVRALALGNGDDDLTAYALELQAAVIEWSKILPKDAPEKKEEPNTDGPYR